ncbi:MAG: hypothetical protein HOC23_18270 [Halieaceae bacterium]|nr:hypothetical protein [Halieaceae bacterium]
MLISVLLAMSSILHHGVRWIWWSIAFGGVGAVLFASTLDLITDLLDGAGQEVANAGLQGLVYCLAVVIVALGVNGGGQRAMSVFMASAVACALIREGSEILVYIGGYAAIAEYRNAVYAGGAIGAGIGISLGILLFSSLRALNPTRGHNTCLILVALIGAGMVMQATMLLEQVDWLPSGKALWDSSVLISEQSIPGELLYAVFGYESTPSPVQATLYSLSLAVMIAAYFLAKPGRFTSYDK